MNDIDSEWVCLILAVPGEEGSFIRLKYNNTRQHGLTTMVFREECLQSAERKREYKLTRHGKTIPHYFSQDAVTLDKHVFTVW